MKSLFLFLLYFMSFFNLFAQNIGCNDDDVTISTGLSIWTDVSGCSDAYIYLQTQNLNCFSELNLPFVSAEPITFAEICCETCQDQFVYGCTDATACNYDSDAGATIDDGSCTYAEEWFNCDGSCEDLDNDGTCDEVDDCIDINNICGCTDLEACNYNSNATDDDGSCNYGLECLISPCSISENPGVDGAYCIDDYCEGCCAIWYNSDGAIIYNSCDNINSNSMIGLWYDFDADQYIEITENVIGFYTYLDDPNFNCWYYWSMDYTNLGISPITGLEMIEFIDEEDGPIQLTVNILDNGNLQLGDDQGDGIELSPINELPELEMCPQTPNSEGCEDVLGQWTYLNYAYIIIDDEGAKFMIPSDESDVFCYDSFELSYSQLNDSDTCQLFIDGGGIAFDFAQISLNEDGTLSLESAIADDFPDLWEPDDSDLSSLEYCVFGCVDMSACNFDPFANSDNGTCGIVDDCGDCQIPYCLYDGGYVDYVEPGDCEGIWIGNNCENNNYCLSGSEDILWNSGCSIGLEEIKSNLNSIIKLNMLGQTIEYNDSGFQLIIQDNGVVEKRYLLNNE